jgi:hypothetical protein
VAAESVFAMGIIHRGASMVTPHHQSSTHAWRITHRANMHCIRSFSVIRIFLFTPSL